MPANRATARKTTTKAAAKPAKQFKQRSLDELLAPHSPEMQALAAQLREIIANAVPEGDEHIYGGAKVGLALYIIGSANKVVCGLQPRGDYCLLYVHNVAADDHPELILEGKGKHCHHVKICLPEGITDPAALKRLLADARQKTMEKR